MAFKPVSNATVTQDENYVKVDWNAINKQVKGGSRPARVSLIVDLGIQEREDFEEEYKEGDPKHESAIGAGATLVEVNGKTMIHTPRKPQQEVAVFVDLTSDIVDYGGEIGKQPYRLLLNKSFMGDISGISFAGTYSYDNKGNVLKDKGFTFHTNSPLTKLAKATKQTQIIAGSGPDNMDVSQLLDQPLMVTVDKTETADGKVYLNYKGCSEVPLVPSDPSDPDSPEVTMNVKPLSSPALAITFDRIKPEDKKWLRGDIIKKIKLAKNFEGSAIQEVLGTKAEPGDSLVEPQKVQPEATTAKPATKQAKVPPAPVEDDDSFDVPF
jgi:hypothetical protein